MAAQHLPRYLGGLAVDKRRTRSNERRSVSQSFLASAHFSDKQISIDPYHA